MKMSVLFHKSNIKIIFGILIISMFLFSPLLKAQANIESERMLNDPRNYDVAEKVQYNKVWDLKKKIQIYYDLDNVITLKTAFGVYSGLKNLYKNVEIIALNNSDQFISFLNSPDVYIKMYFFEGDLYGLNIGKDFLPWQTVAKYYRAEQLTHHILGSGSTIQLAKYLDTDHNPNIHLDKSDIIDAQTAFVFYLFETSDILLQDQTEDYRLAGQDIRDLTTIYFAENMNQIANAQLKPVAPMGERDDASYKASFEKKLDQWGDAYQILPDGSKRYLNDTSSPVADTGLLIYSDDAKDMKIADDAYFKLSEREQASYKAQKLVTTYEGAAETFTITDLPLFSGLEGPVAGIVDTLLDVLIKFGGKKLGINPDLAVTLANTVKEIGLFISDVASGSGDTKDTVKSLIKRIANVAPIPEKLKPWLPIIVDAIFLYKAKPLDIVTFAKDVMVLIFNQTAGLFNNSILSSLGNVLETVMLSAVDLTVRLIDDEAKAKEQGKAFSAMSSIGSFFFEKLVNFTTYEFIATLIGTVNSTVLQETGALMRLVIPLIKGFIFGDLGDVIGAIPGVVEYAVNKISSANVSSSIKISFTEKQKSIFSGVGHFFDLAMQVYTDFSDCGGSLKSFKGKNLSDGLVKLVKAILPLIDIKVGQNFPLTKVVDLVQEVLGVMADASRNLVEDAAQLKSSIQTVLQKYFPNGGTLLSIIGEVLTLLGQFTIANMQNPNAGDLRGLVEILLDELFVSQSAQISVNKVLSAEEVQKYNQFNIGETAKDVIFLIVDSVFGILSLTSAGESAQFLMLDNFYDLSDKTGSCTDAVKKKAALNYKPSGLTQDEMQTQLIDYVQGQVVKLIDIFIGAYVPDSGQDYVRMLSETLITVLSLVLKGDGNSIMPTIQSMLMQGIGIFLSKTLDIDATIITNVITNIFSGLVSGDMFGKSAGKVFKTLVSAKDVKKVVDDKLTAKGAASATKKLAQGGIDFIFGLKDMFTDGLSWIFKQFEAYILSAISNFLQGLLDKLIAAVQKSPLLSLGGGIPFAGADAIGIKFNFLLTLDLNLDIDLEGFVQWIYDMVFKGNSDLKRGIEFFFKKMISFIEFAPIFGAKLEVGTLSTGKPGMMTVLMKALPFDLTFTGKAWFKLLFISIKGGGVEKGSLLRVLEWGLGIIITISKDITVLDVVSGGAGGALNKVGKYIGLDSLKITIYFKIGLEIFYQAAKADQEAVSKLTFFLTVGAKIFIGLSLAIVKIGLELGVEVTLKFVQDLIQANKPLQITLDLKLWAKVILKFLFIKWTGKLTFRPPGFPLDISPKSGSKDLEEIGFGLDKDKDGLSNDLENQNAKLDPNSPDTDNDQLPDKFELRVSFTDPANPDTDGDGVTDFVEFKLYKTDPFVVDTDLDGLSDYEEIYIYKTNAKAPDTDGDRLNDWWEVKHEYNMTGIDPSVKFVVIGGEIYTNKTDPLDADTDDDGIPDGQEDVFGPYFGEIGNYYNDGDKEQEDGSGFKSEPNCFAEDNCLIDPQFIRNGGYTHPLDNDTDDDSYFQFYNGAQYYDGKGQPRFIGDLSDGAEIAGIQATVQKYDPVRDTPVWVTKVFFTNPTNPDSDGDSAVCRSGIGGPGYPWGVSDPCTRVHGLPDGVNPNNYLNGDGYELFEALTDPLDPDTDSDGLIDGLEGTLLPLRDFTTNPFKPDSDGDGLPDGLEFTIGTRPDNPDTDNDQVLDGDEFYKFFTDPLLEDTDFDGVSDGWELFFSHSSPHSKDSDLDGLTDFEEIYYYATNPTDEDSDNDDLTDQAEVLIHETDPNKKDTDGDGLRDGEEIFVYFTDPFNKDTDGDSILFEDENGEPTFTWYDGQEVARGTDPNSQDTDLDSITDAWEEYLATSDKLPIANIGLDPTNNDTDGDGLLDGQEILVNETYSLIYPYTSYFVFYITGSSPVDTDTDDDGLDDFYEVTELLNPNSTDSDGDGLLDWDELFIHLTDPRLDDTDGDGITDDLEVTAAPSTSANSTLMLKRAKITGQAYVAKATKYLTSASDPDTDNDGWPDGMEVNATDGDPRYDPYDPDVNRNGVKDGYERDFDNDRISDGDEYYTYQGTGNNTGGFLSYKNPDSDFDGLLDGDEILIYGTLPYEADTDNDTFSDSIELYFGTDPLVFTPEWVFLDIVQQETSPLKFVNPTNGSVIPNSVIKVEVLSLTDARIDKAWVQYREITTENSQVKPNATDWSENYTMVLDSGFFGLETPTWISQPIALEQNKDYEVRVYAVALNYSYPTSPDKILPSVILQNNVRFRIQNDDPLGLTPDFYQTVAVGVIFVVLSSAGAALYIKRRRVSL